MGVAMCLRGYVDYTGTECLGVRNMLQVRVDVALDAPYDINMTMSNGTCVEDGKVYSYNLDDINFEDIQSSTEYKDLCCSGRELPRSRSCINSTKIYMTTGEKEFFGSCEGTCGSCVKDGEKYVFDKYDAGNSFDETTAYRTLCCSGSMLLASSKCTGVSSFDKESSTIYSEGS